MRPSRPSAGMTPIQRSMRGKQPDESGEEREQRHRAQRLGVRRTDGPRTEPAQRVKQQKNRYQENRNPEDLQRQIADDGAEDANPVVRRASGGRIGRGVQRRIERRVRNQGEDKEDREDEDQEADQLIEPPVGRRSKCARDDVHFGVRSCRRTTPLARTHAACSIRRRQKRPRNT